MPSTIWRSLAVLAVMCKLCLADTQLEFSATPLVITEGITKSVTMHCGINDNNKREPSYSPEDIAKVASLSIANSEGQTVATVLGGTTHVMISKGGVTATGSLTGHVHLDLTFSTPADVGLGVYKCEMVMFSTTHKNIRLQSSLNLKTTNPMISDVIASFKNEMKNQHAIVDELQQDINTLQEENNQLQEKVKKITACDTVRVAFTARHEGNSGTEPFLYHRDNVIQYKDVVENINNDYNASSSVFRCSEAGVYQFVLHVTCFDKGFAKLQIKHNGVGVTTASGSRVSTSAVIKLAKGDTVKVVAKYSSSLAEATNWHWGNTFSGFLVSSDKCLP